MSSKEKMNAREKAPDGGEKKPDRQEKTLDGFSASVQAKKEEWYDRVKLNEKQLTIIIRVCYALLGLVAVLIILEAAGAW